MGLFKTDTINESTTDAGVTVEGVLIKDGAVTLADAAAFSADVISEKTAAAGVTVDSVLLKDGGIRLADAAALAADVISEKVAAAGVTVDSVLLKDGGITLANGAAILADVVSEKVSAAGVTVDGALIKDGSFIGKQATATATAAGLTTGLLSGADQFVTVTSANAGDCICLPSDATCPIGTVIRGWVGANGFELRSLAADTTQTINGVTAGITNEAAIPATTLFRVEKVASLTWILTATDEVGAVITAIIPDTI